MPNYRYSRTDAVQVPRSKINWRSALGLLGWLSGKARPSEQMEQGLANGADSQYAPEKAEAAWRICEGYTGVRTC